MPSRVSTVLCLAILAAACAEGGSGRVRRDAGPADSGPRPVDAGRDAPTIRDAGPALRDSGHDAGLPCTEMPCRLVEPQCGCPAGEGCYLGAGGARECFEAGRVAPLVRCAGAAACRPGYLCVGSRGQNYCQKLCESDADCGDGLCVGELGDGMGGTIPGVRLCSVSCDPISSTPCPTGSACMILREEAGAMRFYTNCRAAGTATDGAACTDARDCASGLACVGPTGGPTTCERYCVVSTGSGCTAGGTCTQFSDMPTIGGIEYGACQR